MGSCSCFSFTHVSGSASVVNVVSCGNGCSKVIITGPEADDIWDNLDITVSEGNGDGNSNIIVNGRL